MRRIERGRIQEEKDRKGDGFRKRRIEKGTDSGREG